jgi:hypothetical protein
MGLLIMFEVKPETSFDEDDYEFLFACIIVILTYGNQLDTNYSKCAIL